MTKFRKKIINGMMSAVGLLIGIVSPIHADTLPPEGNFPMGGGGGGWITPPSSDIFGTIEAPAGVAKYNEQAGGIGLILFASNLIRVATIVAGIWVMINFILAGWMYITSSGDSKANSEASSKMTNSIIGLVIIVAAYTIAALLGLIIFGDASYIINPKIQGVGEL